MILEIIGGIVSKKIMNIENQLNKIKTLLESEN